MNPTTPLPTAISLMTEFAALTGLDPLSEKPQRYLWTDAFAVCNFLELFRQTGDEKFMKLALRLVEQVHNVLGRYREDDERSGWISGLSEEKGKKHPTIWGLRIGKKLPERRQDEPFDETLEWERDGQYYHYLTKWMHALNRVSRVTGDITYLIWAIELAKTAHARFTYTPPYDGRKRMYWKMSTDLFRPLVASMGQHDPLDGYITYLELQAGMETFNKKVPHPDLKEEIADMAGICKGKSWLTDDPLGLGGLLADAYRVGQLMADKHIVSPALLQTLLETSLTGLASFSAGNSLQLPAVYRLAFRELGLSIGLHGVERLQKLIGDNPHIFRKETSPDKNIARLVEYFPLIGLIENFWLDPANRKSSTWREHRHINMVMLATSLAPDGFLAL